MKLLLIACTVVGALSQEQPEAGPYEGKIESMEPCSDQGKEICSMQVKYDGEKDVWNGVLYKKDQLGDNVMVNIEVLHQVGEEWKKEFSQNVGGICTLIKAAPDAVMNFLEALNIRDCPISEGTSIIKDLKNSFRIPFMKEMRYGKRQVELTMVDKEGNRLACFSIKGDIIPKSE